MDEVADDGEGADVLVEERFGDELLVVGGEAGGAELIAWLGGRISVRDAIFGIVLF